VIRAEDVPTPTAGPARPPRHGRPEESQGRPGDESAAGVYVYRENDERASRPADDAAYWYDDLAAAPAPAPETGTRGPFEPLISSSDPPGTVRSAALPAASKPDGEQPAGGPGDDHAGAEDPGPAHDRKLEQIKDLYLTAEAIGEENVDKHFDQLMAQQRELISEFFRQSGKPGHAAQSAGDTSQTPPEDAGVPAEPPAW
jgi:hypothetical protein